MLTSTSNYPDNNTTSIQFLARPALAFGVLSSAAEAQINSLVAKGELSNHDCLLVAVLKDAIKEGRVCLNNAASYGQFQY